MASESSDEWLDQPSERFEFDHYSLSADVSESESSSSSSTTSFSCDRRQDHPGASTSYTDYSVSPAPLPEMLSVVDGTGEIIASPLSDLSEVELMKERFAKLLLGEDMSGGGKGVCTALAISNAITNLSASVFGELWKLEPLAPLKKKMWRRELEWLLCVSDSIVELVPSTQELPGGGTFEVMVPQPRSDLYVNLPALKKLDAMLLGFLDGFCSSEFYYVDRGITVSGNNEDDTFPMPPSSSGRPSVRQEEKWWLPFPKVPRDGLSVDTRKRLQQCRECTHQILKAAMAINSNVLAEMEIPRAYLENLPKTGKACLGEIMYRYITANNFSPGSLLDYLDLSSEYTTMEMANRVEAAANIWRQKNLESNNVHTKAGRTSWRGKVKGFVGEIPNRKLLAKRADILLQNLRLRFPGLPQTTLDMSKIQHNKDVGHAIIESYSRVMESLAFNTMARIDDLLYVDDATKRCRKPESTCQCGIGRFGGSLARQKRVSPDSAVSIQHKRSGSPFRFSALDSSNEVIKVMKGKGTQFHID